jgi:hypothetical protein
VKNSNIIIVFIFILVVLVLSVKWKRDMRIERNQQQNIEMVPLRDVRDDGNNQNDSV